jgi:hypothetical protein
MATCLKLPEGEYRTSKHHHREVKAVVLEICSSFGFAHVNLTSKVYKFRLFVKRIMGAVSRALISPMQVGKPYLAPRF